jgi:type I restriction enzyme S subunit
MEMRAENRAHIFPPDWLPKTLGEFEEHSLLLFKNGFSCGTHEINGQGVPHLRPFNVTEDGRLSFREIKTIPYRVGMEDYALKAGDILYNNTNSEELVGKCTYWSGVEALHVLSNHMTIMRVTNPKELDPEYLAFHLFWFWVTGTARLVCRRHVNQASIGLERMRQIVIHCPSVAEQRAIAMVLSKIQAAVEVQEKIVATLMELKAATMAKLFREGLRGEPLKQTEIGEIPESWEVVRLGDICSYTTGKLNSEKAVEHGEYPFFTCSQETFRINSFSFDQEALLLAGNNAQGKYSVKYYSGKFDAYQRTYVISIKDTSRLNYRFLLHELARKLELLRRHSLGATTKYLTTSVISNLKIAKPSLNEQEKFAAILSAIDDSIGNEEKRHTTLKSLFASMLQQLMTGQVRVSHLLETPSALVDV